jgi:hypothetical protein
MLANAAQSVSAVVLRRFKAGYTIPAHVHPDANEWAYVLSREEAGVAYTTGALFFERKRFSSPLHVAGTDVISLTTFDGPLTIV